MRDVVFALVAASIAFACPAAAAPLELDPTFSGDGRATVFVPGGTIFPAGPAPAVAIQPDGKVVTVGEFYGPLRLLTDGTLDPTFGTGGIASGLLIDARDMALSSDGGVLVVGGSGGGVVLVGKWTSAGVLDPAFGTSGTARIDLNPISISSEAIRVLPDERILVAGWARRADNDLFLARFEADGTLDPTFGTGGIVFTDLGTNEGLLDLALLPDGRIVAAGGYGGNISVAPGSNLGTYQWLAVRYDADGILDPTFGTGGVALPGGQGTGAIRVVRQPDGKLVLTGGNSRRDQVLYRLDADGALDTGFGTTGQIITPSNGPVVDAVVQTDESIVALGETFTLLRYLGDGSLDPTIGPCASVETDFIGVAARAGSMAQQADGRLVVGGGDNTHLAVARYRDGVAVACVAATRAKVKHKFARGRLANLFVFKWDGPEPLAPEEFGDPLLDTDFSLCFLEEDTGTPIERHTLSFLGGDVCEGAPCWRPAARGFKYKRRTSPEARTDKTKLLVAATANGGGIRMRSLRSGNRLPTSSSVFAAPLTVRLVRSGTPACWEATFDELVQRGAGQNGSLP